MAAKLLRNFKHLKGVNIFLLILDIKTAYLEDFKEKRIAIPSLVGLDNLSSNLRIIKLGLIT